MNNTTTSKAEANVKKTYNFIFGIILEIIVSAYTKINRNNLKIQFQNHSLT